MKIVFDQIDIYQNYDKIHAEDFHYMYLITDVHSHYNNNTLIYLHLIRWIKPAMDHNENDISRRQLHISTCQQY